MATPLPGRTGWIDGMLHAPGDRRNGGASVLNMALWRYSRSCTCRDAGAEPGIDRLGAVALLKFYDAQAHVVFDNFFNVPTAPDIPKTIASTFDQSVVLSWGSDPVAVNKTGSASQGGYNFKVTMFINYHRKLASSRHAEFYL